MVFITILYDLRLEMSSETRVKGQLEQIIIDKTGLRQK
jgi:hypothetical protein